jgi:1-acyl-sn-glycerol-3-phosphate acyltransferase
VRHKLTWATFVPAIYWSATWALRGVLWVVGRWHVEGRDNVPADGALIVVSNHLNNTDPPILAAGVARRRIRFMAKIELYKYPFGVVPRLYGAFPVRRLEADMGALLNAERILKNGGVLGMFPEGTRSRARTLGTPHPGTALIALRTGAPILPCAITGTEQLHKPLTYLRKPRVRIRIGQPFVVEKVRRPTEADVSALTRRIFDEIAALLPPQYVGTYTGTEEVPAAAHGDSHSGK